MKPENKAVHWQSPKHTQPPCRIDRRFPNFHIRTTTDAQLVTCGSCLKCGEVIRDRKQNRPL